jgi:hypothetical protein
MTFKCPKCSAEGEFRLSGALLTYTYMLNSEEEEISGHCTEEDWDYANVECCNCGFEGEVNVFRGDEENE